MQNSASLIKALQSERRLKQHPV